MEYLTALLIIVMVIYAYLVYRMACVTDASVKAMQNQTEAITHRYSPSGSLVRSRSSFLYHRSSISRQTASESLHVLIDSDIVKFGDDESVFHALPEMIFESDQGACGYKFNPGLKNRDEKPVIDILV